MYKDWCLSIGRSNLILSPIFFWSELLTSPSFRNLSEFCFWPEPSSKFVWTLLLTSILIMCCLNGQDQGELRQKRQAGYYQLPPIQFQGSRLRMKEDKDMWTVVCCSETPKYFQGIAQYYNGKWSAPRNTCLRVIWVGFHKKNRSLRFDISWRLWKCLS
jgi:hypothetical protein